MPKMPKSVQFSPCPAMAVSASADFHYPLSAVTALVPGCDGKCYGSTVHKSLASNVCAGVTLKNPCAAHAT
jgi:hypothetical protein